MSKGVVEEIRDMQISDDRMRNFVPGTGGTRGLPDEADVVRGGMSQPGSFKIDLITFA